MEENGSTREEINYRIRDVNYNMFSLLTTKSDRITRMFIFGYMTTPTININDFIHKGFDKST